MHERPDTVRCRGAVDPLRWADATTRSPPFPGTPLSGTNDCAGLAGDIQGVVRTARTRAVLPATFCIWLMSP